MQHPTRWKNLTYGLGTAAALAIAAAAVLVFARVGTLHGPTVPLYVATDQTTGLMRGSEVWLDGQKIGLVGRVAYAPPSASTEERVILRIDVLRATLVHLRSNTRAGVQNGGSLLGAPVVNLVSGTSASPPLAPGDTIRARGPNDIEGFSARIAQASRAVPVIVSNVSALSGQFQEIAASLGRFAHGAPEQLSVLRGRVASLTAHRPPGTLGLALASPQALLNHARSLLAAGDSLSHAMDTGGGSIGRLGRDSTLAIALGAIRGDIARLDTVAQENGGSLPRLQADSAVYRQLGMSMQRLDSLLADVRKRPQRYLGLTVF